jgi:hypothetical protein
MAHGRDLTTEADIDAAMERSKGFDQVPRARTAYYNAEADIVVIRLSNGRRFIVPREELKGLEHATVAQLSEIEIYAGLSLAWPQLDVDHYLPYLLEKNHEYAKLMQEVQSETVEA